jgi:hypothetical protein
VLNILPYQLFLEHPAELSPPSGAESQMLIQELTQVRQKFISEIDELIEKHEQNPN